MDQFRQHDTDESVEEEIIEDISKLEDLDDTDFDDSDDIPIFFNDPKDDHEKIKSQRTNDDKLFDDDIDKILTIDNIAKHFTIDDESDTFVLLKVSASENKKENSPVEDTIFINDKKVSISSLKKINERDTSSDGQAVNKMEKIASDFLNDILDDITEESETESREKEPVRLNEGPESLPQDNKIIEKGSLVRNILKSNLFDGDHSEIQNTVIDNKLSADSSDLNEQMDSQEIFKETALNSIATTSTEYRTMNEYLNCKIFDADSEYYDRATYIKSLQAQLQESSNERLKLSQEIGVLKAKFESSNSQKLETFSKRIDDLKNSIASETHFNLDDFWIKIESFIEFEINLLKNTHQNEIEKLQESIGKERKENELEMTKLRQLLTSVKSDSSCIDELRHELEVKHAHEMKELREYFEKRCLDLGKEYTEEVLSLNESIHSKKMAMSSQDVETESHKDILTDDYAHSAKDSQFDVNVIPSDYNAYVELQKIKSEYERSLKEQIALAREDVLHEIEKNIQSLLSENFRDDSNWPPELILLREKLTAANQLEIAQLKIKHEEEMARIKSDSDIELQRRLKRHATFDSHRDLDKIISERDNLRELSSSLRFTLCELAKCFNQYDEDLNNTINEELKNSSLLKDDLNASTVSSKRLMTFKPDISGILSIVEDPNLLEFISSSAENVKSEGAIQLNIVDCLNRLRTEANNILELSEQIQERQQRSFVCIEKSDDKADSCEEEDGLRRYNYQSLDAGIKNDKNGDDKEAQSLPIFLDSRKAYENGIKKPIIQQETYTEGYGLKSPTHKHQTSLKSVYSKAKELLAEPTNLDNTVILYQLVEDFCRETDYFIDSEKKMREDLQKQLEVADKQLKSNKKFLDEQAAERDAERDEFSRELEKLRITLKDKDKDRDKALLESYEKKIANCEEQIKELSEQVENLSVLKGKSEQDLKASIEKVFDLREIISDLESQIQTKTLNENALSEKCEKLEKLIDLQDEKNESDADKENDYIERIKCLEDQLKIMKPSNEQRLMYEQMTTQLKTVEMLLDRKTKTLEAFHALSSACSVTACSSPSEDVSKGFDLDASDKSPLKLWKSSSEGIALPFEEVQRILEKLSKHNRMEEATVKKVTDLEMTISDMRNNFNELQQEKDILQERMSEQLMKISSLQTRLDEQRIRAEELNKQNTSDLTLRVHDLQNELTNLREILSARDKQISNLNQLLEHSKTIIERQDHQLAQGNDSDKSYYEKLNNDLKLKDDEIGTLKNKMKNDMIYKAMIPDLMETMIAEKNDEIDQLKDQISMMTANQATHGSGFLTMISEYDEPDQMRRAAEPAINLFEHKIVGQKTLTLESTVTSTSNEILTDKATMNTSQDHTSHPQMPSHLIPRKIEFSSLEEFSGDQTHPQNDEIQKLKATIEEQTKQICELNMELQTKIKLYEDMRLEKSAIDAEMEKLQSSAIQSCALENELKKKEGELTNSILKIQDLELSVKSQHQDLDSLRDILNEKEEIIQQLSEDLAMMRNKSRDNERVLIDLENLKKQVSSYDEVMMEKETMLKKLELDLVSYVRNEQQLLNKAEQCDKLLETNGQLEVDIEKLRHELCVKTFSLEKCKLDLNEMENQIELIKKDGSGNDENIDRYSIAEIASKLDEELNYAAELDGKILKAIESESEMNSEIEELNGSGSKAGEKIKKLKMELDQEKTKFEALTNELENERKNFSDIHLQDAKLIESMDVRLKAALENEKCLKKLLESEKNKMISLSSHLQGVQRTKSFDSNLIFNKAQRMHDLELESEMIQRLKSEIKMLSSQNDCEKDRVMDLQNVVDRERERFKKTLSEQQNYIDQLKREVQKNLNDNQMLRTEMSRVRERNYMRDANNEFDVMDNLMLDDSAPIAETLKKLLTERHDLQQRILEYERGGNYHDLEEQNNYLIARFMRSESFRKALVFQKKFLLVSLATTIGKPTHSLYKTDANKRKTFRSIALLVIAVERFKFIAKRWTGKRVIAKAFYASPPKRSQSASNNSWTTLRMINFATSNPQPRNFLPSPTQPKQSQQLTRLQTLFHDTQQ